jgi:DNA-binding NtrC family response regulator
MSEPRPRGDEFKPGFLIISDTPEIYRALVSPEIASGLRTVFCGKSDNLFSAIEDRFIRTALLELGPDEDRDRKLLKIIRTLDPMIEIVLAGPPQTSDRVMDWIALGATDYFLVPLQADVLPLLLRREEEKRLLRRETFELELQLEQKYIFQGMVGKSPFMLDVFGLIENVAKHFSTVLVTGETGAGKELAALALHTLSPLRERRFVTCDCAALPENLLESELFGYLRGAFTGAEQDKKGLFAEADRGIIFLDEIGEVPLAVQSKLLRVIELGRFRPVGATSEREVEVRIIAATNQNLEERVRRGTYRQDLFHRLNKVEVHLPPLRDRAEDIPLLVRHFLPRYSRKFEKSIKGVSREVQKFFRVYSWPGNVRELENAMESACLTCGRDFIDLADLPKYLQKKVPTIARKVPYFQDRTPSLRTLEREYIEHLLKSTGGNIKKTAELLKISRTSLYNKLAKYGLDNPGRQ